MTPQEIVLNHVIPGIGVVVAVITFGSPLPAVLEADKTKDIKSLNPLPFVAMAANCTLGSFYGQITRDWYLVSANSIGVMLSWFYITTSYKFLAHKQQDRVTAVILAAVAVFLVVGSINLWQVVDMQKLWGSTAVAILGIYYVAPLTSLLQVLRERDSSSIYWPLSLTNFINAALWFCYGAARKDWFFIALPNAMGVAFNTLSLLLCIIFPATAAAAPTSCCTQPREPSVARRLLHSFKAGKGKASERSESLGDAASAADLTIETDDSPQELKHPHVQ